MQTFILFCLVVLFVSNAFVLKQKARFMSTILQAEKSKYSFMDILSGKAQVMSEKRSSPELFATSKGKKAVNKKVKIDANAEEAIAIFKKEYPTPLKGGSKDMEPIEIASSYYALEKLTGNSAIALEMVKTVPAVLVLDSQKNADNFEIFTETYGRDEALGLIRRNPNILAVPTRGYGSAEVAKEDAMAMSYVIAYTRPLGPVLLLGLFGLLLTPAIKSVIGIE